MLPVNTGHTAARANEQRGFDRGFVAIGAGLLLLVILGVEFAIHDLVVWAVMTLLLWGSVGVVMVLSRVTGGRWE